MTESIPSNLVLFTANNTWMLVSTILVFIMHLGFASLEVGLTRAKNTVNILFKNVSILSIGIITYALCGFNLMYPGEFSFGSFFGFGGFGINQPEGAAGLIAYADGAYTYFTDFIFQAMFAATAATIVSGAVAERIKLSSFLIFSLIYVAIIYPIAGSWDWGKGWLDQMGFYDFAGSTLVHAVGGWGALVVIYFLGARKGRFGKDGAVIPGSNIPLSAAGVVILWLGWFGFNGGSVLSADPALTSVTLVNTCLAAAAGGLSCAGFYKLFFGKADIMMFMNGVLGGLVGITAGADLMLPGSSIAIGIISGPVVFLSTILLEKAELDDPVGAIPVHLFCGIWGTLAVGIFGSMASFDQFMIQFACVGITGVFCIVAGTIIVQLVKAVKGLRVSEEAEEVGLDISEHDGSLAYAQFQITSKKYHK